MDWKIALSAFALATFVGVWVLPGCGGDDCTRAQDHFDECAAGTSEGSDSSGDAAQTVACSGAHLCKSQCINAYTCQQIVGQDPTYLKCLADCNGK